MFVIPPQTSGSTMPEVIVSTVNPIDTTTFYTVDDRGLFRCIGIPMKIVEQREFTALAAGAVVKRWWIRC